MCYTIYVSFLPLILGHYITHPIKHTLYLFFLYLFIIFFILFIFFKKKKFAATPDPDFEEAALLEQYQVRTYFIKKLLIYVC